MAADSLPLPLALARAAKASPDAPLFQMVGGRGWSFGDMQAHVEAWREALADVRPGDHVATLVPASADALALWMALGWRRAVEAPINLDYRGELLRDVLAYAEARCLIVHRRFADAVAAIADDLPLDPRILVLDEGEGAPARRLFTLRTGAAAPREPAPPAAPHLGDLSLMLFTSGTTGAPKGAMIAWAQVAAGATAAPADTPVMTTYSVAPLFHTGGRGTLAGAILGAGPVVMRERFSASNFWSDVERHGCARANLMAALLAYLGQAGPPPDLARSPLRYVGTGRVPAGFQPIARALGLKFAAVFNMTEISPPIASAEWGEDLGGSCGRLRDGYRCRIVDEEGRDVAEGEPGELVLKADDPFAFMQGYWRRPAETAHAWRDGWFHTGDLFRRDAEGAFHFLDRSDDRIRRRGENISPEAIETVALTHPAVDACAAVGVRSATWDDEVMLVVQARAGAVIEPAALHAFLAARLPAFMTPRHIGVAEALPRTPTGKIQRAALRRAGVSPDAWDALAAERRVG